VDDGLAERLFKHLDEVALRPAMYVGRCTPEAITNYLFGLRSGLHVAQVKWTWKTHDRVAAEQARGWTPLQPMGIAPECKSRGFSEKETVQELIAVEAEAYRRALARIGAERRGTSPEAGAGLGHAIGD
jgi:hypothetical protein